MDMGRKSRPAMTSRRRRPTSRPRAENTLPINYTRWLKVVAVLFVVILLALAGMGLRAWLLSPLDWPVRVVKIDGIRGPLSPQQVKAVVAKQLGAGFFGLNLGAVAKALTGIPWVYRADVGRRWPDALIIRLTLQQPIAYWGTHALLNKDGDPFSPPVTTFPKGLPFLAGPAGKEHEVMQRFLMAKQLFADDNLKVTGLSEDARRAYRLYFANGIELVIGRKWDMQRMARLAAVYARVLASKSSLIARIDLRYPNGFVVAWKESKTDGAVTPAKE